MTTPIHRWKERVTYGEGFNGKSAHWTFDGKPCWLASGLCDRNGVEIYEGDIVKIFDVFGNDKENIQPVTFHNGAFWTGDGLLVNLTAESLEVVGHISEGKP